MTPTVKRRRKAIKIEYEESDVSELRTSNIETVKTTNSVVVEGEERRDLWEIHLDNIRQMRSSKDAPVDTMGCHMLADKLADPKVFRFQTLLSLMLSSQTKDQVTAAAMHRLKERGCTVDGMISIPVEELEQLLVPVGFYKRKAVYIKKVAEILKEKYDSDIPRTVEDLCSLPGVGEKMAYLATHSAWGHMEGLGVDTHVHRIVNRLAWVKTSTPKQTRLALEAKVPREHWEELNKLLVGFGQQTCLPLLPKCSECLNKDTCAAVGVKKSR